ncbi:twin-arginine translocation signal domain-containing protein [Scytonema sp. UIC 10036]|uniref:vanadium-dependent haloperoxidase n=1 Tax=Scytonema sp. UIC 10036 TaxID=2304196 RepID=UPI0012DA9B59|nr:vanadium-dependent haloperoxidase [Scytonema sp. UIC 10036]MUG94256.1 twin-arginine translocation signal domain-containing protein [Scytonema sp. UIC 10036]
MNSSQNTDKQGSKRSLLSQLSRRSFLGRVSVITATGVVGGVMAPLFSSVKKGNIVFAQEQGKRVRTFNYGNFVQKAYQVRVEAAKNLLETSVPPHPTNGDEERYPNKIATDTRGLPHDERGEVQIEAYNSFIKALTTQNPDDFENIILGGGRKLVNPQGPLAISLEGINAAQVATPVPPTLDSAEQAAEAVELYWAALLREVPLREFQNDTDNPKILAAIEDLNKLSAFRGPKDNGVITPQTLFRASVNYVDKNDPSGKTTKYVVPPGVTEGPFVSQFSLLDIPLNTQFISPLIRTALPGNEFLTDYNEWLTVQNGGSSGKSIRFDPTRRYISSIRDIVEYGRINGALFYGVLATLGGIGAPLNPSNPYINSRTQVGSAATFAAAHFQALLLLAPSRAIRASYWGKFYLHRRLRPEAYGGLVYNKLINKIDYPIHSELLNSRALAESFNTFGTYLLPHAYPEGAPFHSAYTAGSASTAGVSVTLLKAFFEEDFVIPNPVVPDPNDPTKVIPYRGVPLTVGGELNKFAVNYTFGRSLAGIHWRSDIAAGLALGEEVAISILRDERLGFNERFDGFTFTKFDGTKITV